MTEAFPGNSRRSAAEQPEQKLDVPVHESVVQGRAIQRKKSLGRRLRETFFAADAETVIGFVISDVIVPTIKSLIKDSFNEALERAFNGTGRGVRTANRYGSSPAQTHVSYNRYSSARPTSAVSTMNSGQSPARRPADPRDSVDIGEIVIEHRVEAEAVLDSLMQDIASYNRATVGSLYSLIGQTPVFTDHRWGWKDLSTADIKRVSGGYMLMLPPVEDLR